MNDIFIAFYNKFI